MDVLVDEAGKLTAFELKAGETISADFFKGLDYFSSLNKKPVKQYLIYGGVQQQKRSSGAIVKPWHDLLT